MKLEILSVLVLSLYFSYGDELPTLYEYYTQPSITSGLSADLPYFTLNEKNITIFSGTLHYFRVHPSYWRDRLRLIRSAGLIAVETYVPWNLHQPGRNQFDFGDGGSDFEMFLDIENFLRIAQEEDLFVIIRPGPYICAEWEFGGMPSWILQEENMKIRSSDTAFLRLVQHYFDRLIPILAKWEFTKGGPIIAVQIENEYGSTGNEDRAYLEYLRDQIVNNGLNTSLLVTSGSPSINGTLLPEALATVNFQDNPQGQLDALKEIIPDSPLMVMEYWTGWYDIWGENHQTRSVEMFEANLDAILSYPASVNFYMFIGGTNWGFLNGANMDGDLTQNYDYHPVTSSYDYDAPVSENGNRTEKWYVVKELVERYNEIETKIPDPPEWVPPVAYDDILVEEFMPFMTLLVQIPVRYIDSALIPMEDPLINDGDGQSYGYLVYGALTDGLPPFTNITIRGHITDTVVLVINDILYNKIPETKDDLNGFGFWRLDTQSISLMNEDYISDVHLQLMVENFGRNNFGTLDQFNQHKGLWQGDVYINDERIREQWNMWPLEFKSNWTNSLDGWTAFVEPHEAPALYKATLIIDDEPRDTYIDLRNWTKGVVIVNGFVLSRYFNIGPQYTAYLPAPFLHQGNNTILIFDHYSSSDVIKFTDTPIFENPV